MSDIEVSSQGHVNPAFVTTPEDAEVPAASGEEETVSTPPSTREEHAVNVARTEKKTSGGRTECNKEEVRSVDLKENKTQGSPLIKNQVTYAYSCCC